ncbi:response regulator transcription factor [Aquimarina sp. MMG016]|uniref:response regulator transcription factor n=1 Tax=Aquimarina sp. MMG016 TaxID=2822690 RepID=UPI001B3A6B50|nr:response regulator transcription factor [Aquimarina sp. MMG016]MBQ4820601.1 response regulator transcription factor [Aquimarina sp. MMG016]
MNRSTIFIADDHPLLLKGMHIFLTDKGFDVVDTSSDGLSAYNNIIRLKPEIALLDIQMPKLTGIEIARKCLQNKINTKIILLTLHKNEEFYFESKNLNVYGYLLKEFALEEIEHCLKKVSKNETYQGKDIQKLLNVSADSSSGILKKLTTTERKVLYLIAKNKTSKEIAAMLFVTIKTIEKHRANIRVKLGLEAKTHSLLIWVKENYKLFL